MKRTLPAAPEQVPLSLPSPVEVAAEVRPEPIRMGGLRLSPTAVYDTYWRFAVERQNIFFRRIEGAEWPLTDDPVLRVHRFTNAYRASDRVSQFLIRNVAYAGDPAPRELFFRVVLFKLFNRIETWRLLERELGRVRWDEYAFERYDAVLSGALAREERIYSAAYIVPPPLFGELRKHQNHLRLLERMIEDEVPERLAAAPSLEACYSLLRSQRSIGDFLAYQLVIDLNYTTLVDHPESEFVVPGPGARDGIRKCFGDTGKLTGADVIRAVTDRQAVEFDRLGLAFPSLWGRPLQLIDCQNLFCEVDKYARVAHPEIAGLSGRTRIKQRYRPESEPIRYWYPPKWGINDRIAGGAS